MYFMTARVQYKIKTITCTAIQSKHSRYSTGKPQQVHYRESTAGTVQGKQAQQVQCRESKHSRYSTGKVFNICRIYVRETLQPKKGLCMKYKC